MTISFVLVIMIWKLKDIKLNKSILYYIRSEVTLMSNDNKFFTKKVVIFLIISLLFVSAITLLCILNLTPIFKWLLLVLSFAIFLFVVIWCILIAKYLFKSKKLAVAVSIILVSSLLAYGFIFYGLFSISLMQGEVLIKATSPSGNNTVVVLEGGFIDAIYTAYPLKFRFFYQKQDNGFVSNHDDWGGAKVEVEWLSDNKAKVKILSGSGIPNKDSNEDNNIIVDFN